MVGNRINRVFDYLSPAAMTAEVIAIYEVAGDQVVEAARQRFPHHQWTISDGSGSQRILVGSNIPGSFVTVRSEFTRGYGGPLRPGVLMTVEDGGVDTSMLFLHLKAADVPVDFGVRADQHQRARNLRWVLDGGADGGQARFIIAGDFNSVGLGLSFSRTADISSQQENDRIEAMYESRFDRMQFHLKNHPATFWNGPGSSDDPVDIDHVISSNNIQFGQVPGAAAGVTVEVKGWPEEATPAQQGTWIDRFSDHAALRFTVI